MSKPGDNLPGFRSVQLDFAAYIRNPEVHPAPDDVEARRMNIYADLFFNNIKSFLDSAFPVSKQILGRDRWRALVREFVHLHASESPYFLQISQEFMTFLHARGLGSLPPFLLELCHYEWVELALDVAEDADESVECDPDGELLGELVVTNLVRALVYEFPVHTIGPAHQPAEAPTQPTYLLVYRNPDLAVRFMESNPVTHRLLELLGDMEAVAALELIRTELEGSGRDIDPAQMREQGLQILTRLRDAGIILGERGKTAALSP